MPITWFDDAKTTRCDPGPAGGLEDVVGADEVVAEDVVPRCVELGRGGEVHDRLDPGERGLDRVEIEDVGDVAREVLRRQRERDELEAISEMLAHGRADRPLRTGDEDAHERAV